MPTGGISAANIAGYLAFEKVLACGGSWMVPPEAIKAGDFGRITALCAEALGAIMGFSLAHIGINGATEEEPRNTVKLFELLFGFSAKEGNSSIFVGEGIEVMKSPYLGKNGHIAIAVNSLNRAMALLERRGFAFNRESRKLDPKGALAAIYLKDEIAGFAVHLVQKK